MNSITITNPQMLKAFERKEKLQHRVRMENQLDLQLEHYPETEVRIVNGYLCGRNKASINLRENHGTEWVKFECLGRFLKQPFDDEEIIFVKEPRVESENCFPMGSCDGELTQEWDSRFKPTIKNIWPQKLSEMTEDEAVKEGFEQKILYTDNYMHTQYEFALDQFIDHWNQAYGKQSFNNDWAFILEFGYE